MSKNIYDVMKEIFDEAEKNAPYKDLIVFDYDENFVAFAIKSVRGSIAASYFEFWNENDLRKIPKILKKFANQARKMRPQVGEEIIEQAEDGWFESQEEMFKEYHKLADTTDYIMNFLYKKEKEYKTEE